METEIEMERVKIVDKNELVDKGEEIYKRIRDQLEKEHRGEFLTINVDTGEYWLGRTAAEADKKGRENYPDEVFYLARVGRRAAFVRR